MNKESGTTENLNKATFAGGCFWCMEWPFDRVDGVKATIVGYTGGKTKNPTYQEVSSGATGHFEAVEVHYDPAKVSYEKLLNVFWHSIDPTDARGQFADKGSQYYTAIFYHDENQKKIAEESKKAIELSGQFNKPIAVQILPAGAYYRAENYHQDYYKKNSSHYKMYSVGSGRAGYLEKTWGKEKE